MVFYSQGAQQKEPPTHPERSLGTEQAGPESPESPFRSFKAKRSHSASIVFKENSKPMVPWSECLLPDGIMLQKKRGRGTPTGNRWPCCLPMDRDPRILCQLHSRSGKQEAPEWLDLKSALHRKWAWFSGNQRSTQEIGCTEQQFLGVKISSN